MPCAKRVGKPLSLLRNFSIGVPIVVIITRECRAIESGHIVTASRPQDQPVWKAHLRKRPNSHPPIVVQDRFLVITMVAHLSFQSGLCPISQQIIRRCREPFRRPVQVFESFSRRNEVLMIVADRENDFVQIPIDRRSEKLSIRSKRPTSLKLKRRR